MAMLSWTPKGIAVSREMDNRDNGQRQQTQWKGKVYLISGQKKKDTKHLNTENEKVQQSCINLICSVTAVCDQLFIRGTEQPASSSASLQLVVGLKGSIRLNLTFFIGYKKAKQTGEGQLQASAKQLTGDLAQQRFLPRCPTLFLAWSLCCSTPPVFFLMASQASY